MNRRVLTILGLLMVAMLALTACPAPAPAGDGAAADGGEEMADEVVIMRDGYIEQRGTPMQIYDNPDNLFVARFIGSPGMNILECEVIEDNGRKSAKCEGGVLPLPESAECRAGVDG